MSETETTPEKTSTLYERIGGAAAVDAAVDVFYSKVITVISSVISDINII